MANGTAAKAVSKPKGEGFFSRVGKFIRESYVETCHKSAWPTKAELRQFTIVVLFAVLVVAFWIGGLDFVFDEITKMITAGRSQ